VRAMLDKTKGTGLAPWLCATTVPLFAFSCVSLDVQQSSLRVAAVLPLSVAIWALFAKGNHVLSPRLCPALLKR
jgi:hypothetical protein